MKDITRLLGSWPSAAVPVDGEEQLRGYMLAVDDYPAQDVTAGVDALIKGTAPGVNPNFLPPPAVVGSECHRQNNLRCTAEARDRALRPALPPPDIERSPESQQRVRDLMERTVNSLKSMSPEDDPKERHRKIMARTNEYFDGERERGFVAGDPEDAADAA